MIYWLMGRPCCGKTTLGKELVKIIDKSVLLDGDLIRSGLSSDLEFSHEDRIENTRRVSELAVLLEAQGYIPIVCLITQSREAVDVRDSICGKVVEVFVDASLEECINRDDKGLYEKALCGEIENFTGVGQVFENPLSPHITVNTEELDIKSSVDLIVEESLLMV